MNVPVGPGGAPRRRRSDPSCAFTAALAILMAAVAAGAVTALTSTPQTSITACTARVWHHVHTHTDPGPLTHIPACDGLTDTDQAIMWANIGQLQERQTR